MATWHWSRRADLGLRTAGLLLCSASYAAFARLVALHLPPQSPGALALALAAIGFLAASAGSALLITGRHLFDEVAVSSRWYPHLSPAFPLPPEGMARMNTVEPAMPVVGQDADGSRSVREGAGLLPGQTSSGGLPRHFDGQLIPSLRTTPARETAHV